ncbi:hypothetical protein Htur_4568 (plasmid) [Haloterrigena turkmenica DSM 5511]|uniref:Uncharacterized protein n=1 Tax=Haloterrigena turkmenica (strain ATCC 51198 / DSM 5511 / JCM 9101 / NCIMB 13204 / VKM B-1734 / 4k) TaxID=543526 RepID=D2S1W5_HALTV|nr:hypothetical protein Htur_4568 [Haloterrigena turkmenica DSM 5511]
MGEFNEVVDAETVQKVGNRCGLSEWKDESGEMR